MTTATIHHQRNYNSVGGGGRDIVGQSQGYKWSVLEKSLWTWTWWMLLLSGGVSRSWAASSNSPYANFTVKGSERFNHLVVAIHTGTVYIGAVNRIYQLSNNLQLQVTEVTGPKEDSPDCPVTQDCPDVPKKPTDNVNKALVFDYSENRIISCGSLYQGVCTAHNPFNISIMEPLRHEAVVANSPTASTVAFIAPGPPNPPTSQVLNVGVSYTGNGPYRSDVPAVSSRSLDDTNLFEISVSSVTSGTRMTVSSLERERYPITYVYGFDSRGFSYFLTTQKRHTYSEQPFISKLIRLCPNDPDYYSYTEIPLECRAEDGTDYNLAQAAYVASPRSELTIDLDVSAWDDMLFVVFAKSSDEQGGFNKPGDRSALCIYSVKNINRKFTENIQKCFIGSGDRGLDFITPDIKCVRTHLHIGDDFCGLDINTPLGGQMAATAIPVITYQNPLLTSVAAIATHNYTVAFLGTATGHLKKVVVESASKAFEYSDLVVEEGSGVNADMQFDRSKDFIYVMTERMVSRIPVQECDVYKTRGECLVAKDPYCGWCSLEDRYMGNPIIDSVESGTVYNRSPRGIPSGGIVVTVLGKNLDAVKQPKIFVRVRQSQYEGPCEVESPVLMKCRSPTIPAEELKDHDFDTDNPLHLDYGFAMDKVTKYRNMSVRFMLFPDPKYHFFEDKDRVKFYNTDYLTINGENLDLASDNDDVRIEIGTSICNVTSLSRSQLTCRPPTRQPPARNADGSSDPSRIPDVVVIVGGGSLNFTIGKLRYESPGMVDGGLPLSRALIDYWKNLLEIFISHFI